jgi:hypothetical protein
LATEIAFSIPVSGVIHIEGDRITITVNQSETSIKLQQPVTLDKKPGPKPGKTLNDIALEAAREFVSKNNGANRFSAADLYRLALVRYPDLKRNSFMSRIIADTPNHSSNRHFASGRDYFRQLAAGLYQLNEKYLPETRPLTDLDKNLWR